MTAVWAASQTIGAQLQNTGNSKAISVGGACSPVTGSACGVAVAAPVFALAAASASAGFVSAFASAWLTIGRAFVLSVSASATMSAAAAVVAT